MKESNTLPDDSGLRLGRRNLLKGAALGTAGLSLSSLLAACGGSSTPTTTPQSNGNFPTHPQWNFVFVNHVTTNPFFVPTQYGIQDAVSIVGCKYQWTGSATSSVSEMVNAMNAAIAAKADGIAVAIIDPTAFNAPVQAALSAGIPVLAYNADAPAASKNARLAYIGQDLFASGVQVGNRIASLVPSGDIVGFIATPGSLNIQPRIDGIKSVLSTIPSISFTEIATGAAVNDERVINRNGSRYRIDHRSLNKGGLRCVRFIAWSIGWIGCD